MVILLMQLSFRYVVILVMFLYLFNQRLQDLKPSNVAVNEDCELRVRLVFSLTLQMLHYTQ